MLHAQATARHLATARIVVFGVWFFDLADAPTEQLGEIPIEFLMRLGVLRLLSADTYGLLLRAEVLLWGKALLLATVAAAALGLRPYRVIAILAATGLTLQEGLVRGFSFLNHAELCLLNVTYVLALAPATDAWAVWPPSRRAPATAYGAALTWMALVLLMPYAIVGSFRLSQSSPDIFLADSMRLYVTENILRATPHQPSFALYWLAEPFGLPWLDFGFALTTVFEVLSPLCLLHRRLRYAWLAFMLVFHSLTFVLMHILFWQTLLLVPILLLDRADLGVLRSVLRAATLARRRRASAA